MSWRLELWLGAGLFGVYVASASASAPVGLVASLLGALLGVVAFRLYRRLGASERRAALLAGVLGLATLVWPSARRDVGPVLDALLFTGFVEALLAAEEGKARGWVPGLWSGLLVVHDPTFILATLGGALHLGRRRATLELLGATLPFAVLAAFGPLPDLARYRGDLGDGLWGLFLSTGKGILAFSPPVLLGTVSWAAAARRRPRAVQAIALCALPPLLLLAKDLLWGGGFVWGPERALWIHPVLLAPLALVDFGRAARIASGLVIATGLAVQIVATAFAPGVWWTLAHDVSRQWLGKQNLAGTKLPCTDCFEETYRVEWLPPFQPVTGHVWLLLHLGQPYETAEPDAPWRRYVRFHIDGRAAYDNAHLDWRVATGSPLGIGGLVVGAGLAALAIRQLRRELAA